MPIVVRPLRDDELRTYLEIHTSAVRGLAATHYAPEVLEGWVVPITDETLKILSANADGEMRFIAELDGTPAGMTRLDLAASLNAEPFYAAHGYQVTARKEVVLRNGHRMPAVWMGKAF